MSRPSRRGEGEPAFCSAFLTTASTFRANMMSLRLGVGGPLLPIIPAYVIYVVIFGVAIWSTFQDSLSPRKWLRIPLLAMFLVLTSALLINILQCVYSHALDTDIMQVTLNVATCLAGGLSDGLLAWRCFVLFGKRPWMKWLLVVLIALDFGLGSLSNIAYGLQIRVDEDSAVYIDELASDRISLRDNLAQELTDVWAWLFFALNTTMTMSIIYKVFSSANRTKDLTGPCHKHYIYNTVIRAIIESALIVWIGLLTYAIAITRWFALGTANTNDPSTAMIHAEQVLLPAFDVLPFIFGISQSLIIARIGFSRLRAASSAVKRTARVFASDHRAVEEEEPTNSVLDISITRNVGGIEMFTKDSSTLA